MDDQKQNSVRHGRLTLARWFQDHAVLQRNKPILLKGSAESGQKVQAVFDDGPVISTKAGRDGRWSLSYPPQKEGGPHLLTVSCMNRRIVVHDILFGDVFVLAGQSNMQLWMGRLAARYPLELKQAHDGEVRFFRIPETEDFNGPQQDLAGGEWLVEGKDDISSESGIGYFLAKRMRAERPDVPLGLIETALGGTPIEPWIDESRLRRLGADMNALDAWKQPGYPVRRMENYRRSFHCWIDTVNASDPGIGQEQEWNKPEYDDTDWKAVSLASASTDSRIFHQPGTVWMRRTVEIPSNEVNKPALLRLGTIVDADECWVNGMKIGETGYRYPPRDYSIPALGAQLQITERIRIDGPVNGGITAGKEHAILIQKDSDSAAGTWTPLIDLDRGKWKIRRGARISPAPLQPFASRVPSGCFNAMIAPLAGMGCSAIIWYQGESSATRGPEGYGAKMIALVQSWREVFRNPCLPFVEVQLPNIGFEARGWARLRDEQRKLLALDGTAMTVTIGLGDNTDLHPTNKDDFAARTLWSIDSLLYHAHHSPSGPLVCSIRQEQGRIRIFFTCCDKGLAAKGPLAATILVPGSQPSHWAAHIVAEDEMDIPLPCDTIFPPGTCIRFEWGDAPTPHLFNGMGQPASPFEMRLN